MKKIIAISTLSCGLFLGAQPTIHATSEPLSAHEVSMITREPVLHQGFVRQTIDGGDYLYLDIDAGANRYWVAAPKLPVKVGDEVRFIAELVAEDFKSQALNRTFKELIFTSDIEYRTAIKESDHISFIKERVEKSPYQIDGTISVFEAVKNRKNYGGKSIKIRGKIVKLSRNILERDWVHIQDGTGEKDVARVVFTGKAGDVKVGDIVIAEGKALLDKDFGSGYVYPIVMENSTFKK